MLERGIKERLKKYLDSIGAYWFMPVQTGFGASTVDFLVCYKGKFYGIETKSPSVKRLATIRQEFFMERITKAGGKCCVENSPGLESVRAMMEE